MFRRKCQIKLIKKQLNETERINQTVTVVDLVVSPSNDTKSDLSHGEKDETDKEIDNINVVQRLLDQIKILFFIAQKFHQEKYMEKKLDGTYLCRKDALNKIVRLTTWEFAFFTKRELTLEEYLELVGSLETLAKTGHQNIILVLSSFAVKINHQIFNFVIHMQCGPDPVLTPTAKAFPWRHDPAFRFPYFQKIDEGKINGEKENKNVNVPLILNSNLDPDFATVIPYNPVIIAKTSGGANFICLLEVCRDHDESYAKKSLSAFLQQLQKQNNPMMLPLQITHVVTSNQINLGRWDCVGDTITHADSNTRAGVYQFESKSDSYIKLDKSSIKCDFSPLPTRQQYRTRVKHIGDNLYIQYMPFGLCDYKITAYAERPLSKIPSELKKEIETINKKSIISCVQTLSGIKKNKMITKLYNHEKSLLREKSVFTNSLKNSDSTNKKRRREEDENNIESNKRAKH